jgi:hypothetical protein
MQSISPCCPLFLFHVHNAANAITLLHVVERSSNISEWLSVSDELIDLELALHVVVNQIGELCTSFDAAKCTTLPDTSGDKLERWQGVSKKTILFPGAKGTYVS